jgi:LPXTG-motif cell wall-anchored protein
MAGRKGANMEKGKGFLALAGIAVLGGLLLMAFKKKSAPPVGAHEFVTFRASDGSTGTLDVTAMIGGDWQTEQDVINYYLGLGMTVVSTVWRIP